VNDNNNNVKPGSEVTSGKTLSLSQSMLQTLTTVIGDTPCDGREQMREVTDLNEKWDGLQWQPGERKEIHIPDWIGESMAKFFVTLIDDQKISISGRLAIIATKVLDLWEGAVTEKKEEDDASVPRPNRDSSRVA
jgi:hypothetical protein